MTGDPKVAIFMPSLEGGGAEKCMLTLAEGLARRNAAVSMILSRAEGIHMNQIQPRFQVVNLGSKTTRGSILGLIRWLQTERPDVLISALDHANVAALVAKHVSGVSTSVIVTTHTMASIAAAASADLRERLVPRLMRLLYPTADAVVAVSRAIASDLTQVTRLSSSSIHVIYNPVAVLEIDTLARIPIQNAWFSRNVAPAVIAIGSLRPHKDHATLLRALSIAGRTRPLRLIILGEGPERQRLAELAHQLGIEKCLLMPGFERNPYSWLARCQVFALPSKWEGLPTVLIEAMSCGISPVATDCPGGSAEILEHGKYGRLVPVGDAPAMAEAILKTLETPFQRESLRRRAEAFSLENAVERYLAIIRDLRTGNES